MDQKTIARSITLVLVGTLLTTFNSIGTGWAPTVTAIIGYVFFFQGLGIMKLYLDEPGKAAVKLLTTAVILGLIGTVLSLIPVIKIVGSIVLLIAFVFEILGFLKLKASETIGVEGQKGVQFILVYIILVIVAVIIGIIPAIGSLFASVLSLIGLILLILGWIKVQEGLIK